MAIHVFQGSLIIRQEKRTSSIYLGLKTISLIMQNTMKNWKKKKADQIMHQNLFQKKKMKWAFFHINHKHQLVNIK